ncbi:glycogen synthase kinase-3 alpha, putative [Babesia caballi]|uniref:non-specific serine/threonine protein kinase n=1 Tax=Babesia caballi TaxID=5871 RepID=A0AAV4LT60_BABCB|nr:glycogen synthase kinase-3 alpha, putative [Babesia caballi]
MYSSPTQLQLAPSELTFHKRIARGAFGSVYLATDPFGTKYAVKRTRKFGMKRSRELMNLGLCRDAENVMQYRGTFYTRNRSGTITQNSLFEHLPYNMRAFIRYLKHRRDTAPAVEYPVGHSLRRPGSTLMSLHIAAPTAYSHAEATEIDHVIVRALNDVLNGILELHSRGLVHRDLKPDNVLVDDDHSPTIAKICDLGSAKKINQLCLTNRSDSDLGQTPSTPNAPAAAVICVARRHSLKCWGAPRGQPPRNAGNAAQDRTETDSRCRAKRIDRKWAPQANPRVQRKQLELVFQAMQSKGSLRTTLTNIAKGNARLMAIANVAYNLLRWCPEDRISMEDARKMLNAGRRRRSDPAVDVAPASRGVTCGTPAAQLTHTPLHIPPKFGGGTVADSKMKDEISQLVDSRGRRPTSNEDAFKLYNFSVSLPVFRRKYDWKVPKWEAEQIKDLHIAVRKQLATELAAGPSGIDARLGPMELPRATQVLKAAGLRTLYALYIDVGPVRIVDAIVALVRREDFTVIIDALTADPDALQRLLFPPTAAGEDAQGESSEGTADQPEQSVELGALWSRVADDLNANLTGPRCKLATECCTIFLNSTPEGALIETVEPKDVERVREYTATLPPNEDYLKRGAEVARELGLTLFQLLKAEFMPEQEVNKRWDQHDDERLIELVQRQVNARSQGPKRFNSLCWKSVARQMGNKTNVQCRLRWRSIGTTEAREEAFDDAQLYMLQILHAAYGDKWISIARMIPGKNAYQCRTKFLSCLSPPGKAEYVKYYKGLRNAIASRKPSINVRRWWVRVDWLGIKLLKLAHLTKNATIMKALEELYESGIIMKRIDRLFGSEPLKWSRTIRGIDILTLAEYLKKYSSRMVLRITNSLVSALLRKSRVADADDFKRIFDLRSVDEAQFEQSLKTLLECSWP